MTLVNEETIFNKIFLNEEKQFPYPTLQNEAVEIISTKLTDAIYAGLKKKNTPSSKEHLDLLTFINCCCKTNYLHSSRDAYKIYLNAFEKELLLPVDDERNTDVESILCDSSANLPNIANFENNLRQFYNNKHIKQKAAVNKLNFIKEEDKNQLNLISGVQHMGMLKNLTFYQTSEKLLQDVLGENVPKDNTYTSNITNSLDSRKKQIKFCYACLNVADSNADLRIMKSILMKMLKYDKLEQFEINFLVDLFLWEDQPVTNYQKFLIDNFSFILEKFIIEFATEVLLFDNDEKVRDYFTNLKTNKKIIKIRQVCKEYSMISSKLKTLLLALYVNSYCNTNIMQLLEIINLNQFYKAFVVAQN